MRLLDVVRDPLAARSRASAMLLLGVLGYCAFWELGQRSLHVFDTTRWGELAREMVRSGEWLVPQRHGELYVNKPPLYLWAVALPSSWFGGVTPFWVRLPSAMGLVALVWTTARWTQMRLGSRRLATTAALMTLSTLGVIWLGREGRLDMMASALAVSAAYLWDRAALGKGGRSTPWVCGVVLGCALLTKGPPLLIAPVVVLFARGPGQSFADRLRLARPWIILPVAVGVALCWFVPATMQAGWDAYGRKLLVDQAADRIAGTSTHTHGPLYYFGALPGTLAPWGVVYLLAAILVWVPAFRRMLARSAPMASVGSIALLLFVLVPTKHTRYVIPLVPIFAMPVARAAWHWIYRDDGFNPPRWVRIYAVAAVVGGFAAIVLGLLARFGSPLAALTGLPILGHGLLLLRNPVQDDDAGRRIFLGAALLGTVLALTAILSLRTRWFTTSKETFSQAVAATITPNARVVTLDGESPGLIFHATPWATKYRTAAEVPFAAHPGTPWVVICHEDRIRAVESASGRSAKLIARRPDAHCVAVLLPAIHGGVGD